MRTFIFLAAVALGLAAQAAAHVEAKQTTTLIASKSQVGYGKPVLLTGRVSNRASGVVVAVDGRPFSSGQLHRVAIVRTGASGRWTFTARPRIATTYKAIVNGTSSPSLLIDVRPALALAVTSTGDVVAHAGPTGAFRGRFVQLQRRTSPTTWFTLAKQPVSASGTTVFPAALVPEGKSHLRLVMSVNQAGVGYLGGFSQPVVYSAHAVSLSKMPLRVVYGGSLQLAGRISTAKAGATLQILARPFTQSALRQVATVRTTAGGRWQYRVRPPFTTSYAARWGNGQTRVLTVGVQPAMTVRLLAGDRVWAHVGLQKSVSGKTVQLQQKQPGGSWKTVATAKLGPKGSAVFAPAILPPGSSTLRAAISVNQVGAGFLGGFSRSFVYHR
jgi:hypothetical protein